MFVQKRIRYVVKQLLEWSDAQHANFSFGKSEIVYLLELMKRL